MAAKGVSYTFSARVWYSEWYFVSLPQDMSGEIRRLFKQLEEGWGRLNATARLGSSEWKTAIWFNTEQQTYFLPVKKAIRTKEKIKVDDVVTVTLWF